MARARRRPSIRRTLENRPPKHVEDRFARLMRKLNAAAWPFVRDTILPLVAQGESVPPAVLDRLQDRVNEALPDEAIAAHAREAAGATDRAGGRAFMRAVGAATGLRIIGSDRGAAPPVLPSSLRGKVLVPRPNVALDLAVDNFVDQSVRLISTLRAGVADGVGDAVVRARVFGGTPEELAERLRDEWARKGVPSKIPTRRMNKAGEPVMLSTSSHADLIARDQLQKLHGRLNEARQRAAGVDSYTWRTQGDDRVRPEHAAREGRRFKWDEPPEDGHPGEPVMCRCFSEAVLDRGQILNSEAFVEVEVEGPFSERQSPAGVTLINPGPGAML